MYNRQTILDELNGCKNAMNTLYQNGFINRSGVTSDTGEYYTEIISEWLIANLSLLQAIPTISRKSGYFVEGHDGVVNNPQGGRDEENMAKQMKGNKYSLIGEIIDYQTPLKNSFNDEAGKIDLLSYDGATLRILELKAPGNTKESMLRCVLEGYTYLKTVDTKKLLESFKLPPQTEVKASPLVYLKGRQHDEMNNKHPNLQKFMQLLDVKPFYYDDDMNVSE